MNHKKIKLVRLTTHSQTLGLLKGQIGFIGKEMDVILVAKDTGNLRQLAASEGVQYRDIDMHREINIVADLKSLVALIKLFRHERPDIVHANTPKGALLGLLAAWICRVPKRIYNVNGLRFETATGNLRRFLVAMEKIACICATKVIPQSNGVADVVRQNCITSKPLNVILNGSGNGVDINYFNPELTDVKTKAQEIQGGFEAVNYVFVGRLVGDKGVNELVEAFCRLNAEYPDTKLHLVGGREETLDALRPETIEKIETNSAIIEHGRQSDVRPFLRASDVFVLPSYREGFPNVVLEAMAMSKPCIATDVNGAMDAIEHGKTGFIIPKRDVDILYYTMATLYSDSTLRVSMGEAARLRVSALFNCQDVWRATLDMYHNLF